MLDLVVAPDVISNVTTESRKIVSPTRLAFGIRVKRSARLGRAGFSLLLHLVAAPDVISNVTTESRKIVSPMHLAFGIRVKRAPRG